jgi:hypothetical protein
MTNLRVIGLAGFLAGAAWMEYHHARAAPEIHYGANDLVCDPPEFVNCHPCEFRGNPARDSDLMSATVSK